MKKLDKSNSMKNKKFCLPKDKEIKSKSKKISYNVGENIFHTHN